MKSCTLRMVVIGPIAFGILLGAQILRPEPAHAQKRAQEVITMETGVQHEGELGSIENYTVGQAAFSPFASNNIVLIDDVLRRVFVNKSRVVGEPGVSKRTEIPIEIPQKTFEGSRGTGSLVQAGPFNEYGHRELVIREQEETRVFVQGITEITPRWCKVNTLKGTDGTPRNWEMFISTSSVPKSVLRSLLLSRIDQNNVNEFYDVVDFFSDAGDFDQANQELALIERNFPDQKERVDERRVELNQFYGRKILREVETRIAAGQPRLALGLVEAMTERMALLSGDIQAAFQAVDRQQTEFDRRLVDTRQTIFALINGIQNLEPGQQSITDRFKQELETELGQFNVARLDAFLNLAKDRSIPDANKLALAISGWIMGSNRAINNLAIVEELYPVKDLVLEYLAEGTSAARRAAILEQLQEFESGNPEYIDAILKQAKPIAPMDLSNYTGEQPLEFTIELPGTDKDPGPWQFQCQAHLPPEYNPYRQYPLLITLPDVGRPLGMYLDFWAGSYNQRLSEGLGLAVRNGHAMHHGYIVVAVDWRRPGQSVYRYSAVEHRVVIDGLYQALRRFSVDSDKVFLAGHGTGGDAAYDIAVAHPEHFAGVLGFSGKFDRYVQKYDDNEHVGLPIYCVVGEKDYTSKLPMQDLLNQWLRFKKNNRLTLVEYKGRPNEYFLEEIPAAFNWMRGQNRRWPDKRGFSFECKTIRNSDSYFWFFEMDGIPERFQTPPALFTQTTVFNPLVMAGNVQNNRFRLDPKNVTNIQNRSTLWLSPEFFDFSEELVILGRGDFKGFVKPSNKVLLNDVLRRADPKHAYWAAVEMVDGSWKPK